MTLDSGQQRTFRWVFTIAAVVHFLIGYDFLPFFNLNVGVEHRCLSDEVISPPGKGYA